MAAVYNIKVCMWCYGDYQSKSPKSRFCGRPCRRKFNAKNEPNGRQPIECKNCKNIFLPKEINNVYCKSECQKAYVINWKPNWRKEYHLQKTYGLTLDDWNNLFNKQGQKCAICKTSDADRWCVDHNHITGAVRGILCVGCNAGIGNFKESIEYMYAASIYIANEYNVLEEMRGFNECSL